MMRGKQIKNLADFKKSIRNLINELPNDQREVVLMRMYYDMSFKEISDFTNVSINTQLLEGCAMHYLILKK